MLGLVASLKTIVALCCCSTKTFSNHFLVEDGAKSEPHSENPAGNFIKAFGTMLIPVKKK